MEVQDPESPQDRRITGGGIWGHRIQSRKRPDNLVKDDKRVDKR